MSSSAGHSNPYAQAVKDDPRITPPRSIKARPSGRMFPEQENVLAAAKEWVQKRNASPLSATHRLTLLESVRQLRMVEQARERALMTAIDNRGVRDGAPPVEMARYLSACLDAAEVPTEELEVIQTTKAFVLGGTDWLQRSATANELVEAVEALEQRPEKLRRLAELKESPLAKEARRLIGSFDHAVTISNTPESHISGADFEGAESTFRDGGEDVAEARVLSYLSRNPSLRELEEFEGWYEQIDATPQHTVSRGTDFQL